MADPVRIFVSHHHSDDEDRFTQRLVKDLESAGANVWVDMTGITSDDFVRRISEGMAGRQWLVLVMTPGALKSPWVQREVNAALAEHTAGRMLGVLPLVMQPCQEADIPILWRTLQRYDATRGYETALAGLLRAMGLPFAQVRGVAPQAPTVHHAPARPALPPLGPAPAPDGATPAYHLTPSSLYNLGFRGYSRNGVEFILPPICPVPGGVFTMGSDKTRDKEADDREMPQYPVHVGDFSIGQHPVTVAAYACAVRAKAVREPPEGFRGMTWAKQLERLDHPVTCVSWTDVLAYVRWLAKASGQPWRLPTEAEWEKAARGSDGRIYPWGDAFDKARCNTSESGIKTTTPVGRYPNGASPCGAQDMAGNVWEWTSSLYKPYPYTASDGREDLNSTGNRVLRGGSWDSAPRDARVAFRDSSTPDNRNDDNGFRLVVEALAGS